VRRYLAGRKPLAEFVEVESGRRKDPPKLRDALALCRVKNAVLIIAKLDRLARNVAFISALMESDLDFTALDLPQADRLWIHIFAAVAEHEARLISARTKAALHQAKLRGVKLGNPKVAKCAHLGGAGRAKVADAFALAVWPQIERLRRQGITARAALAKELSHWQVKTWSGRAGWTASMVHRVIRRVARIEAERPVRRAA
jgi:DNA invertase Pin-like site-specific DNA recombinase